MTANYTTPYTALEDLICYRGQTSLFSDIQQEHDFSLPTSSIESVRLNKAEDVKKIMNSLKDSNQDTMTTQKASEDVAELFDIEFDIKNIAKNNAHRFPELVRLVARHMVVMVNAFPNQLGDRTDLAEIADRFHDNVLEKGWNKLEVAPKTLDGDPITLNNKILSTRVLEHVNDNSFGKLTPFSSSNSEQSQL